MRWAPTLRIKWNTPAVRTAAFDRYFTDNWIVVYPKEVEPTGFQIESSLRWYPLHPLGESLLLPCNHTVYGQNIQMFQTITVRYMNVTGVFFIAPEFCIHPNGDQSLFSLQHLRWFITANFFLRECPYNHVFYLVFLDHANKCIQKIILCFSWCVSFLERLEF